jgi:tetratricopeptide (TPR) repeat protein
MTRILFTMTKRYEFSHGIAIAIITIILFVPGYIFSQSQKTADYKSAYEAGEYAKALEIINKKLDEFYSTRVDNKRIPISFISLKKASKDAHLKMLFRDRKAEHFFIEDNPDLSTLHLFAARCHYKLSGLDQSLSHYVQSLRFKKVEDKMDDVIYYEIAQVYKKGGYFNAYINALETAAKLNRDNYSYSLELGKALYRTGMKKRAIHHLTRYINSADEKVAPELYLMLGNLHEDVAQYLETEKYYLKYLAAKPDDGFTHFALGHIAYMRTGNYALALQSFDRALKLLSESEIFRRSKIYEYKADIVLQELNFESAVEYYSETIKYQNKIGDDIKNMKTEIADVSMKIRNLKSSLLREENFDKYEEYENLLDTKGKKEIELRQVENEYNKLNAGKVRWNIAYSFERMEKFKEAIQYYRESIAMDYNSNEARKKIINLELKIKRGY